MTKRSSGVQNGIMKVIRTATSIVGIATNLKRLLELEIHEAGKSLVKLVLLFVLATCVLSSIWLCLLAMLFIYFISLQISMLMSLFIILLLNLILLLMVMLIATRVKKNLTFARTRRLLRNLF